jgi:hypothetical protein
MAATLRGGKPRVWGSVFRPRFFRAGVKVKMEINSENLAAQIHHLIRKRFCHLNRKIILA